MSNKNNPTTRLRITYITALCFVGILIIFGVLMVEDALYQQRLDSTLVNLAGRQRMQSQRLCKIALLLTRKEWFDEARKKRAFADIQRIFVSFSTTYQALLQRNSDSLKGKNSALVLGYYKELKPYMDSLLSGTKIIIETYRQGKTLDSTTAQPALALMLRQDLPVVSLMDKIVNQYVTEAKNRHFQTTVLVLIMGSIIVIIMLLQVFFIFKPLERKVKSHIENLNIAKNTLEASNDKIKKNLEIQLKMQRKIVRSNRDIRDLYDKAPCGYHSLSPEGIIINMNQTHVDWLGYTKFEIINKLHITNILTKEWQEVFSENFAVFKQNKEISNYESVMLRKDGTTFPVILNSVAVYDDSGKFIFNRTTVFDNTDRKKVEQDLMEAHHEAQAMNEELNQSLEIMKQIQAVLEEEQRKLAEISAFQKTILDNAFAMIIGTDLKGTITIFNPAAEKNLGYLAEEMIGKHTPEVFHDLEEVKNYAQKLSQELNKEVPVGFETFIFKAYLGQSDENEWTYIRKDGSRFSVNLGVTALYNDKKEIIGFLGIAIDISEKKETEVALKKAMDENYDLYNQAPYGYHSLNKDGLILRMNQTELDWLGYPKEEVINKLKFTEIADDKSKTIFYENFSLFKKQGFVKNLEFNLLRKDGTSFPVLISAIAVYDEKGNYQYSRSAVMDITERKKMELKIKKHTQSLIKQKEKTEQLNAVKDKLFSIISHDFRSPLNSLKGVVQLLEMDVLTKEETQKIASEISEKVDNTLNLLDNLLQWTKNQMSGIKVQAQNLEISSLAEENIRLLMPHAEKKGIILQNQITENTKAFADLDMTKLVIRNLIANAIKFTHKDGCINISAKKDGNFIQVSIADTGQGISPEILAILFKEDSSHTSSGTANEQGTGLGLQLCRDFVKQNGGRIWVESEPGKGSIFSFTLPVLET